jgi:Mg2+ and Co2+ transporter CorA
MHRFDKIIESKEKGLKIMRDLEKKKREIEQLAHDYHPYDEQKMYERIFDSLTRSIDDIRRAIL